MKKTAPLFLAAACAFLAPLAAGNKPTPPPEKEEPSAKQIADNNCDRSSSRRSNCRDSDRNKIAMEGNRYDNRLSNETNRAAENGNTQREQTLEQDQQRADSRQMQREDAESARTDGRR